MSGAATTAINRSGAAQRLCNNQSLTSSPTITDAIKAVPVGLKFHGNILGERVYQEAE